MVSVLLPADQSLSPPFDKLQFHTFPERQTGLAEFRVYHFWTMVIALPSASDNWQIPLPAPSFNWVASTGTAVQELPSVTLMIAIFQYIRERTATGKRQLLISKAPR